MTNLHLMNNTGTAGNTVTSDPTLTGTLTDDGYNSTSYSMSGPYSTYTVQVDLSGDSSIDQTVTPNWDHTFSYDPRSNGQQSGEVTI